MSTLRVKSKSANGSGHGGNGAPSVLRLRGGVSRQAGSTPSSFVGRAVYDKNGEVLLHDGQRLDQPEFHRRYELTEPGVKAELINGVVYMASPLHTGHGELNLDLGTVLGNYRAATPGVRGADNATLVLGNRSEPQPDLFLSIARSHGGRSGPLVPKGLMVGVPELVVEISDTTLRRDLSVKREDYRRAGVREYLVFDVAGEVLHAFDLAAGKEMPTPRGVWKSQAFPGLWIDSAALFGGDPSRALATLQKGLAGKRHAAFVERLRKAAESVARAGEQVPESGPSVVSAPRRAPRSDAATRMKSARRRG